MLAVFLSDKSFGKLCFLSGKAIGNITLLYNAHGITKRMPKVDMANNAFQFLLTTFD